MRKPKIFYIVSLLCMCFFIYHCIKEDYLATIIPKGIERQVKDSMRVFPKEMFADIQINYTEMNSDNITWATRPSITSFLRPRSKRTYLIQKSKHPDMAWVYANLPYEGQVGILVHELCHILAYEEMSDFEIIQFGYNYQNDEVFRRTIERKTDSLAMIYAPKCMNSWKDAECNVAIFGFSDIAEKYWEKQHKYYLTSKKCNHGH